MREKIRHMAGKISQEGHISALCFKSPRPVNLKIASWTIRSEAVTCSRCLALLPREIKAKETEAGDGR